jgi:M6 family metalloprotease-like protein
MKRTGVRSILLVGTAVGLTALAAPGAAAQQPTLTRRWELRGPPFDFSPDGVWRKRAREVVRARAAAQSRGDFVSLNAPVRLGAPQPSAFAVTGSLTVPLLLVKFADTPTPSFDSAQYTQALFGTVPPALRPYTARTFYEQMSHGLFSLRGNAIGWITLSGNESAYTGTPGSCAANPYGTNNPNGIFCGASPLQAGLRAAVSVADSTVDFGRYDNDGPDGIPNSGDDDGYVDLILFVQPYLDGARVSASNNHVWSHKSSLGAVATNDAWVGHVGEFIKVRDYLIQAGVGGDSGGDAALIMPIGTLSHEMGHGIGLPDFYDTNPSDSDDSEGIGGWGLMGSGNYYSPSSPSMFEALSRQELGWVTVRPLAAAGTYSFGPSALGDTVFLIRPTSATNPRNEYFLLENRQAVHSDSAFLRSRAPGLLVWHVDSLQYAQHFASNDINSGPVHGLVLVEADGTNNLLSSATGVSNRGDAGDPFPGSSLRTSLGSGPAFPRNDLNAGVGAGFILDSIRQLSANGPMSFRVQFGGQTRVAATDTVAKVRVRGTLLGRFQAFMLSGDTATISMDTLQINILGTVQYRFVSWSDGGARTHLVTTGGRDTTLTATLSRRFNVQVATTGPGTVTATPAVPVPGGWLAEGDSVVLVAQPIASAIFMGWSGDVTIGRPRIVLTGNQAYSVTANFVAASLDSVVAQLLSGHGLLQQQVLILDYHGNGNGRFDIGDFVAWLDQSGTAVSAQVLARIFERAGR